MSNKPWWDTVGCQAQLPYKPFTYIETLANKPGKISIMTSLNVSRKNYRTQNAIAMTIFSVRDYFEHLPPVTAPKIDIHCLNPRAEFIALMTAAVYEMNWHHEWNDSPGPGYDGCKTLTIYKEKK